MLAESVRSKISRALEAAYTVVDGEFRSSPWLLDFDPVENFAIAELKRDGKWATWQIPYEIEDDELELGEPTELERAWRVKGTTTLIATKVVEGDSATAFLAELAASNTAFSGIGTPNGSPFVIDLTLLDEQSEHVGTKFVLKAEGAEAAMASLAGKPVHITTGFLGHYEAGQPWRPVGTMLAGKVCNNDQGKPVVRVAGVLWDDDFPKTVAQIRTSKALLGASWEIRFPKSAAKRLDDETVELSSWTYTGAAILLKNAAAWPDTALLHADRALGETITTKQRNKLQDADFAIIVDGERKLPIHDETHRKNAWSRVNQEATDLTDAQRATARTKIMERAKREGDAWAKTYKKINGKWIQSSTGKGTAAMAKLMANKGEKSFSLAGLEAFPDDMRESVASYVQSVVAELESGRELAEMKKTCEDMGKDKTTMMEKADADATTIAAQAKTIGEHETKIAELGGQVTTLTTEVETFKVAATKAELKVKADAFWKGFAKDNQLSHLAQAEVDKRWTLIEKAAQDQPLTLAEHKQLLAGAKPEGGAATSRPVHRGGWGAHVDQAVRELAEVPLMAGAEAPGEVDREKAVAALPAVRRHLESAGRRQKQAS